MNIALSTTLRTTFDDAVARTRQALADQDFGILTEIDVKATMKTKLDADMDDYLILGACNPPLAYRALAADPQIGLLLPCNVVVRTDPTDRGSIDVEAMNPQLMIDVSNKPELRKIADEATTQLQAAIDSLTDR
jgi:uncharacterized protein (DUF302 family)